MNFVFWNVGGRSVQPALIDLISATKANIVVLAEYKEDDATLLRNLYGIGIDYYAVSNIVCPRIKIFTDIQPVYFSPIR